MAIPRPKRGWRWLLTQAATFDIAIAGFAAVVGLTSAVNYGLQRHPWLAAVVGGATVIVLVLAAVRGVITLKEASKKESTHELEGCLHTLHAVLDPAEDQVSGRLRLALHVPVGDMLEQVTEYIGDRPKPGRVGRRFPANAGIIGSCYRTNAHLVASRAGITYQEYVQELVNDWNYTEERAKKLNPATMAWMAVPFYDRDRGRVDAVLYLDSQLADFFSETRQELVLAAVNGIAVFIGKRYT